MHLSDSKREFFAPRGGREICMVGPLSLNGNAAAVDKVRAASNSNAVFCVKCYEGKTKSNPSGIGEGDS